MVEKTKEWFDKKWLALTVSFGAAFVGLFAMTQTTFYCIPLFKGHCKEGKSRIKESEDRSIVL